MLKSAIPSVRERLLAAGLTTFSKSGFNGCSVQDITECAGVPKGSFYNHFESKEALGVAALERFWSDDSDDRLQGLQQLDLTPLQRLRRYFTEIASEMTSNAFTCGCLAANMGAELSDHSPAIAAQLSVIFAGWSRRMADCIREAQEAGEVRTDADPTLLATFVLNAWEGALLRSRIEKSGKPLQQFIDVLFTHFLY